MRGSWLELERSNLVLGPNGSVLGLDDSILGADGSVRVGMGGGGGRSDSGSKIMVSGAACTLYPGYGGIVFLAGLPGLEGRVAEGDSVKK